MPPIRALLLCSLCVILCAQPKKTVFLITDAEGGPWQHSDGTYLVANPVMHNWALRTIKTVRNPNSPGT